LVDNPTRAADWSSAAPVLAETGTGTWIMAAIAVSLVGFGLGATAIGRRKRYA
jgi:LPXTG-motif cell wall-anchored protein